MVISIRTARPDDAPAISDVQVAAFDGDLGIADLIGRIRTHGRTRPEWSIVAVDEGRIVGHVMVSYSDVEPANGGGRDVAVLSPVGVRPDRHRQGIGSLLVKEAIKRVEAAGEPALIVEGDPNYYGRFGFTRADEVGLVPARADIPRFAFQVHRLSGYTPDLTGRVTYSEPFDLLGAGTLMRHHATIFLAGDAARAAAELRRRWDPTGAEVVEPHVTLIYPDETGDVDLLVARLRRAAETTAPFRLVVGGAARWEPPDAGVYLEVGDPDGGFAALRRQVLAAPFHPLAWKPHVTLLHPRTATGLDPAWEALQGVRLDRTVDVTEVAITGYDGRAWQTSETISLGS